MPVFSVCLLCYVYVWLLDVCTGMYYVLLMQQYTVRWCCMLHSGPAGSVRSSELAVDSPSSEV